MGRVEEWHIKERKNGRKGMIVAIVSFLLILLIFFVWIMPQKWPPPDTIQGVLIDFGNSKTGLGDNAQPKPVKEVEQESSPQETTIAEQNPAQSTPDVADEVLTQDFQDAPEINTQEVDAAQIAAEQAAAEEAAQAAAEQAEAEQAAAEQAAAEAAAQELKDELDQAWNTGGGGDGNTTPGADQGVQDGVPDGPYNDGNSSTGLGDSGIGHDLTGRKMVKRPTINDSSQKTGKVAVQVKVDRNGNVVYAKYTTKGSTTTDSYLIRLAEKAAKEAKFNSDFNASSEQVGTIYFTFKVQ